MATKPSHSRLDISKLNFVLQVLRHYKFPEAKWFDFGLNLGLLHPTLKAIESANRGDPSNCLRDCLAKWLTEGSDCTLVWQTLANALRAHGMNLISISNDIRKTMADPVSEILQCYIDRLAEVVLTEESVDLLHTEGLISKDALTEVKRCGCLLVEDPMLLILSAVAEDRSKLCTLTSILMKSKEAVSLADDIIMEYEKSFPSAVTVIPSFQQASTSTSLRSGELQDSSSETQVTTNTDATAQGSGELQDSSSETPVTTTTDATPQGSGELQDSSETQVTTNTDATAQGVVEIIVFLGYKAEFDRMRDMLGTLIHNIVPLIKASIPFSIPSVDDLKTYLGRCRPELKPRLKDANSFDDVMEVIEDECSITNVALLETIVKEYSIQDAKDEILAYQTHLDEFCTVKTVIFYPDDKAKFDKIGDRLGILIDDIAPLIEKSILSLNHLKKFLGRCRRSLKPRLKHANSFDDVMEVIEDECSITNVALLETIVNKYSIQDAEDKILAYQTHLDEFCKNKLFCNNCQIKRSSLLTCEIIKFVLKWNPSEHSLSSIRALLWKMLKDQVTARDNIDMLKEMGLISLTIGDYTVYDEHSIDEVKSLMKKLETERDDLLEENAKLKGTIDTLESEKEESKNTTEKMQMKIDHLRSSLQSKTETLIVVEKTLTEREKEIEQLQEKISFMAIQLKQTSITLRKDQPLKYIDQPKGVYVATKDWEKEENNQLSIKEGEKFEVKEERTNEWWLARSLDTDKEGLVPSYLIKIDEESELSTSEALELFLYAMTENVDIPQIKKVKTSNNRANLFLSLIEQDSVLLELRKKERGKPKPIRWYDDGVELTSPSLMQCQEVVSLLTSNHRSIRIIKSSPDVVFDLLPVLLQNENVKSLTIRDTQLMQDCISSLCNLLANNKSLEGLYLYNCSIDDKVAADIITVLLQNNTLKGLSFQKNTLVTSAISQNLSDLIKNLILKVLDVAGTSISSDGILLILQSLTVNTKMKLYLNIDNKAICTEYRDYNIIKDRVFFY